MTPTDITSAVNIFERIVEARIHKIISPEVALDSALEFYRTHKMLTHTLSPDDDMLLFDYGPYDWEGHGEKFELAVTRQIIDSNDNEYFQIRLILYYKPEEVGDIGPFQLWSVDKSNLGEWRSAIIETEGFNRVATLEPSTYTINWTKTS